MKIIFFILLLTFLPVLFTQAQQDSLHFEHLSIQHGLSQSAVYCVLQDQEGYMWFGTLDGLNKYDGYNFTIYQPNPDDLKNSMRHNWISDIHEDQAGRLWVTTYGGGLNLVDKKSGKVSAFLVDSVGIDWRDVSFSIYEDRQGMLWISSADGLNLFDPNTKKFILYPSPKPGDEWITCVTEDRQGRIFVGTKYGLYKFERETNKYIPLSLTIDEKENSAYVNSLYIDDKDVLWIGAEGEGKGLYNLDVNQHPLQASPYKTNSKISNNVYNIHLGQKDYIWVATYDEGLQRIDKKTGQVITYQSNPSLPGNLSTNYLLSVYQDRSGTIWVGTENGIHKADGHQKKFYSYQIVPTAGSTRPTENFIYNLLKDRSGIVWLANQNGLYRIDQQQNQLSHISADPSDPESLTSNNVNSIYEDRSGRLWIGTPEGLHLLDRERGKFTRYPIEINFRIIKITEDPFGKMWIGGSSGPYSMSLGAIASFDPQTHEYKYYKYNPKDTSGLNYMGVADVLASRTGDIWVATSDRGINRLNQQTGKFTYYLPDNLNPKGHLNDKDVRILYEDREGIIWAGTNLGGLNRLNPKTGIFTYYTTKDGLPNNHVVGITEDQSGNLWISTNKGICRFNPKNKTFRNFDVSDGLLDNEFYPLSVSSQNGELLFGSKNGFVIFHPDSIQDNLQAPPVYITGLKVMEKPQTLSSDRLELPYHQNFLSFDFVALNYNAPEKNQYAYQLVGVDEDWIYSGTRRFASYTELNPGKYIFRVKASNNDGMWNEQGASIQVTILPPFWRTWWAYSFYGLCFIAVVFGVDRFQRKRLIRKEREKTIEKEMAQAREIEKAYHELGQKSTELVQQKEELQSTLEHLQATQTQLIQKEKMASLGELTAGIAHEIQNPLNFVNNFAEVSEELCEELQEELDAGNIEEGKVISEDIRQNLEKIHHHGRRADSIVKSMLQHSRASSGEKQLIDINTLVDEYLRLSYHGMRAKDKDFNAKLITDFDASLGKVEVVPQELGRVLLNLYNNAFYATQDKQKIAQNGYLPEVKVSTRRLANKIEISVKDNGTGMSEAVKQKVFQPFFTTKPTGEGTGLGLSLSYDIITKGHGGEIRVESRESEYAEFIIQLPLT